MEPNGVTNTGNLSVVPGSQQPVQQQPIQQQPLTHVPVQQVQQQVQQPAPSQQQVDQFTVTRQILAQEAGVPLDQVPSDPQTIARIVKGGLAARAELQRYQQQQTAPVVQQQPAQPQPNAHLQQHDMPQGWETQVTYDQQSQSYQPTHPLYAPIAQMANQNLLARQARTNVVASGQLLPEQEKRVADLIEQQVNQRLEQQRSQDFVNQHAEELFVHENGQRKQTLGPDGKPTWAMTDFGLEVNRAADELVASGAVFQSQYALAQLAYRLAKERHKPQQQNGQQQNGFPQQQVVGQNPDLAMLLRSHNNAGTQAMTNTNGFQRPTGIPAVDTRNAILSELQGMPSSASGLDYARKLGWNVG